MSEMPFLPTPEFRWLSFSYGPPMLQQKWRRNDEYEWREIESAEATQEDLRSIAAKRVAAFRAQND